MTRTSEGTKRKTPTARDKQAGSEHTPGPWRVNDDGDFCMVVMDDKMPGLALIAEVSSQPEWNANARLIAAAPDILDALKGLRISANRLCDRMLGGTYEDDCRRSIVRADAALAKARRG